MAESRPERRKRPAKEETPIEFPDQPPGKRRRKAPDRYGPTKTIVADKPAASGGRQSIKHLDVDLDYLDTKFLGKIIPPLGGQVKRAVMETSCRSATPKFSRMSGIQKWKNCIQLFVNVYGNGYKNVFLNGGRQITVSPVSSLPKYHKIFLYFFANIFLRDSKLKSGLRSPGNGKGRR